MNLKQTIVTILLCAATAGLVQLANSRTITQLQQENREVWTKNEYMRDLLHRSVMPSVNYSDPAAYSKVLEEKAR